MACISQIETNDSSVRGELRDACVQNAGLRCKALAPNQQIDCHNAMAEDLFLYADRIVQVLPIDVAAEDGARLSYQQSYKTLTTGAWSRQGCMVPSIATVSVEVRRSLCGVQHSYSRLKMALDAAETAGMDLP